MSADNLTIFSADINDIDQLSERCRLLEALLQDLQRDQNVTIDKKIEQFFGKELAGEFKSKLSPDNLQTPEKQKALLEEALKYLASLPTVKLTLAFEPPSEFVSSLNQELGRLLGRKVVFDIKAKEEIVGGLVIEYDGRYKDYSLASKLVDSLQQELGKHFTSVSNTKKP
jgi:hypothetical protein